jgi:tRNA (guanine26-N2/guanine27-N2)-dimethyltransferase
MNIKFFSLSKPAQNMTETWAEFPTETIIEGKIRAVVPDLKAFGVSPSDYAPSKAPVFFNPVMEFNRDLTVLAFQAYQRRVKREISICEPLTATGIRSIRFAAEIEGVKRVVSSDINERSAKLAAHNIALNNLKDRVSVKHKEANRLLSDHSAPKSRFDIIDIDPFGTPVPHIDAAIQALRNNGLLATTATDMAPLCGVHAKACMRKYGGKPLRTEYCHELAVRFLAGAVATTAAKHDIGTHVLFSHCSNHYIRVYTQIAYGCQKADESLRNMGYVLHCFNCLHRGTANKPFPDTAAKCPECDAKMDYAGPLWLGKIVNAQFAEAMISENAHRAFRNSSKINKLLTVIEGEAEMPPTFYVLDKLSGKLGLPAPSTNSFFHCLQANGFKAVATHFNSRGVRTDALAYEMGNALRKITEPPRVP